jgi:hypothetical protein
MSDALTTLRRAVAIDLVGASDVDTSGLSVTQDVVGLARAHRVQGLLWKAVEAGHISGTDDEVGLARDAVRAALRTCLIAEETAVLAIDALTMAGVERRAMMVWR